MVQATAPEGQTEYAGLLKAVWRMPVTCHCQPSPKQRGHRAAVLPPRCPCLRFWIDWTVKFLSPSSCRKHGERRFFILFLGQIWPHVAWNQNRTGAFCWMFYLCFRSSRICPCFQTVIFFFGESSVTFQRVDLSETSPIFGEQQFLVHLLPTRNVESNHVRAFFELHCVAWRESGTEQGIQRY